jgi:hypothetical protein
MEFFLMSRAAQPFKQGDVTKALRGAVKAGVSVSRVEIDKKTGNIILFTGEVLPSAASGNEWDNIR